MIGLLDCSQKFFKRRVEFQLGLHAKFVECRDLSGKMWFKIAFDHILPCSSFNLLDEKQRKSFNWKCLSPMSEIDKFTEGNKTVR